MVLTTAQATAIFFVMIAGGTFAVAYIHSYWCTAYCIEKYQGE